MQKRHLNLLSLALCASLLMFSCNKGNSPKPEKTEDIKPKDEDNKPKETPEQPQKDGKTGDETNIKAEEKDKAETGETSQNNGDDKTSNETDTQAQDYLSGKSFETPIENPEGGGEITITLSFQYPHFTQIVEHKNEVEGTKTHIQTILRGTYSYKENKLTLIPQEGETNNLITGEKQKQVIENNESIPPFDVNEKDGTLSLEEKGERYILRLKH